MTDRTYTRMRWVVAVVQGMGFESKWSDGKPASDILLDVIGPRKGSIKILMKTHWYVFSSGFFLFYAEKQSGLRV